jgi:endonuclease/exonuclease/phosphatase (EEP) superfamily protein YafD
MDERLIPSRHRPSAKPLPQGRDDGMLGERMDRMDPSRKPDRPGAARRVPRRPSRRRRIAMAIKRMSWAYLIVLLALWIFLRVAGDRWWLATLMLFGPMWVTLLPAGLLIPAAAFLHRRSLVVLTAAVGASLFLLMGFCVPWRPLFQSHSGKQRIRVLTCNIHLRFVSDLMLAELIAGEKADIVLFQEFPVGRTVPFLPDPQWKFVRTGELLVASRFPVRLCEDYGEEAWTRWSGPGGAAIRCEVETPQGIVRLINLHLASPHNPFDAVIEGKESGSREVAAHIAIRAEQSRRLSRAAADLGGAALVAGDFNTPSEGNTWRTYWSQFSDAFATAGTGLGHTYFSDGAAVRIDHILTGSDWQCRRCRVGPDIGSPHRPVIADLEK